jgi:hypothetical protein
MNQGHTGEATIAAARSVDHSPVSSPGIGREGRVHEAGYKRFPIKV